MSYYRTPTCCGRKMEMTALSSSASGDTVVVWGCKCGKRLRETHNSANGESITKVVAPSGSEEYND